MAKKNSPTADTSVPPELLKTGTGISPPAPENVGDGSQEGAAGDGPDAPDAQQEAADAPVASPAKQGSKLIVRCDIPGDWTGAINGVQFELVNPKKGDPYHVSEPVDRETAEFFAGITGYSIVK